MSCGVNSTTLTLAPRASYTVAISRPMIPPPMTSRRPGFCGISKAPVESSTRGSLGTNGSVIGSEPAAIMHCSKRIRWRWSSCLSSMTCGLRNLPTPRSTSTLRCLARPASPPVSLATTWFFHERSLSKSICGARKHYAVSAHGTRVVDHLGRMQQRLGRNAADVQAHAAQRRPAIHQCHLESKIGGTECGRVAPGTRTQHQQLHLAVGGGVRLGGRRGCGGLR